LGTLCKIRAGGRRILRIGKRFFASESHSNNSQGGLRYATGKLFGRPTGCSFEIDTGSKSLVGHGRGIPVLSFGHGNFDSEFLDNLRKLGPVSGVGLPTYFNEFAESDRRNFASGMSPFFNNDGIHEFVSGVDVFVRFVQGTNFPKQYSE
jgi:hypothetical protein